LEKLNDLGLELKELKKELLNTTHSNVVQKALSLSAENLVKNDVIDTDLHLVLTDKSTNIQNFEEILLKTEGCLKTKEELLVEFEKIRESVNQKMNEIGLSLETKSLVDTYQLSLMKVFKIDKEWVSKYFGQPKEEVEKLMVRKGFVEKFAVLRLPTILENFFNQGEIEKTDKVDCRVTQTFYDVEDDYYGIRLIFYMTIEDAEDKTIQDESLTYINKITTQATEYIDERFIV